MVGVRVVIKLRGARALYGTAFTCLMRIVVVVLLKLKFKKSVDESNNKVRTSCCCRVAFAIEITQRSKNPACVNARPAYLLKHHRKEF